MSDTPAIEVHDLHKTYVTGLLRRGRVEALRGVSLKVPRGDIFGLLGPNGANKTTMVKVLLGLVHKTAGQAALLGEDTGSLAARRHIGYLPEHHRIPSHHTVDSALAYYGKLSHLSSAEVQARSEEVLRIVGLHEWGKARIKTLSKGMQQRLGLAQAMLHDPDLLILDEPTDGVDPVGRKELRGVLKHLADEGKTIFLNSHLLQEVELICKTVAILDQGKVKRLGSVEELTRVSEDAGERVILTLRGERGAIARLLPEAELQPGAHDEVKAITGALEQKAQDELIDRLRAEGITINGIAREQVTLEDAFLKLLTEKE